jgi:lipoprotein-anchoring transpeptidase ErfK/SrfK
MHVRSSVNQWRRRSAGIAGVAVFALVLSACSSADAGTGTGTPIVPGAPSTSAPAVASAAKVTITPGGGDLNPNTPIVVKVADGKLTAVTVTNAKGKAVQGALAPDNLSWTSGEQLGYGSTYSIVAEAVDGSGKQVEQKSSVTTVTPAVQTYPAMLPAPPAAGTTFGVGQVIGVNFDHAITDKAAAEKALKVTSTPSQPGSWHWIDNKTVHYRPQNYWQANTTVKVDVNLYGVNLGGGVYGKTDRTATYKIHDSWIAKADGNTETMQIVHNGSVVGTMPISLGKDATPTHVGPHVISDKKQQVVMDSCTYGLCPPAAGAYKATEYWAERISNDGEFVHQNANTVGEQGSSNVSHGCVNLSPENAQAFFNEFNLGDVVEVANSGGPKLPVYDTYGDWELNWADWQAGSALH